MNPMIWQHIHGASTHVPIVLLFASAVFDLVAWRTRDETLRGGLQAAGFGSAVAGLLGAIGAVLAGLVLTRGRVLGNGYEKAHHLFVWPAFACCLLFVGARLLRRHRTPGAGRRVYLAGMILASALMAGAGFSGGQMVLRTDTPVAQLPTSPKPTAVDSKPNDPAAAGRQLFARNCAHCHGIDARGDEGPDLHRLDWTDEEITTRIRNGKKGQMTAFAGKLSTEDIRNVIAYLRTLK